MLCSASLYTQTVWLGQVSDDWYEISNWSNGLPTIGNDASIPTEPPGDFLPVVSQDIILDYAIINANELTFLGSVTNNSRITNYETASVFFLNNLINSLEIDNDGVMYLSGDFSNNGHVDNSGFMELDFAELFTNNEEGTFYNYGDIQILNALFSNLGDFYSLGGTISCNSQLVNHGLLDNYGTLVNQECGIFKNFGSLNNQNLIRNFNLFYNYGSFDGNDIEDRLQIQNGSGLSIADFECTDDDGWTHYSSFLDDKILVSIFTDGQDIGSVLDQTLSIRLRNQDLLGLGAANDLGTAQYIDSDGWYVLNRYWVLKSTLPIDAPLKVRFYLNETDIEDIKTEFPLTQGLDELVFFHLSGTENGYDLDVSPDDASFYERADQGAQDQWALFQTSCCDYVELEVNNLNGAYGAGVKSWLGGTIPHQIDFKATANTASKTVDLQWSTSQESNSLEYILQRSDNGIDFTDLKIVPAIGEAVSITSYDSIDENPPLDSTIYYRLKLIETDGKIKTGPIRSVNFSYGDVRLFPNPSSDELYLRFSDLESGNVLINIFDINGSLEFSNTFEVVDNVTVENICQAANLSDGIYSIQVVTEGKKETLRFVKFK